MRSAQLATFGERVVDVFYVTGPEGGQITDPELRARIVEELRQAYDRPSRTARRGGAVGRLSEGVSAVQPRQELRDGRGLHRRCRAFWGSSATF